MVSPPRCPKIQIFTKPWPLQVKKHGKLVDKYTEYEQVQVGSPEDGEEEDEDEDSAAVCLYIIKKTFLGIFGILERRLGGQPCAFGLKTCMHFLLTSCCNKLPMLWRNDTGKESRIFS